jgi:thioredoxin 2
MGNVPTPRVVSCPDCGRRNRVPVAASGRPRCAACRHDLPWLVDADSGAFGAAVAGPGLVLVDFWAAWCGPCRTIAPILERLAGRYAGRLKVVKLDVDANQDVAARFGARSIPLLVLLRDGVEVERIVGAQPEHVLAAHVDRLLASA